MKRKYIFSFACFLVLFGIFVVNAFAVDYYVDATNGDDSRMGTTPSEAWQTISRVNNAQFLPGDTINLRRGEVWQESLIINSSGKLGEPIIFRAFGEGVNPKLKCCNTFSDWELYIDKPPVKIWKGTFVGTKNSWGAIRGDERIPQYYSYFVENNIWSAPAELEEMKNGFFYAPLNNPVFYFRNDVGNPGPIDIGVRMFAINMKNISYVTVDGIDIYGPGGSPDNGSTKGSSQVTIDACDKVVMKNCVLSYGNYGGVQIVDGSTNCVLENITSYGHQNTGLYFVQAGSGNKAINCKVFNCGNIMTDHGDMGLIGIWQTPDVYIEGCFVENNGYTGVESVDAAISFVQSPHGVVKRCLIKNAGGTALQFAEGSDYGLAGYNIIDGWGRFGSANMNEGIRIGGGIGPSSINCSIFNNLFINGGKTKGDWAALRIRWEINKGLKVKNNIFYNNIGVYEIIAESKDGFINWEFSNNLFYRTQGMAIKYGGRDYYDYKHIIGQISSYYSFDKKLDENSFDQDPKLNYDLKKLMEGSPCIDSGAPVGQFVDYNGNHVPSGGGVDIGPFEYISLTKPENLKISQ